MAESRRVYQIAERIKELLAQHLNYTADPRFNLVTITSVMISPDLRMGKVYWVVSFPSDIDRKARIAEVEGAFRAAQGHFKHTIAKKLDIRFVPTIRFYYDDTLDTVEQVERLMERVKASDPQ